MQLGIKFSGTRNCLIQGLWRFNAVKELSGTEPGEHFKCMTGSHLVSLSLTDAVDSGRANFPLYGGR